MPAETVQQILVATGSVQGTLPFRYLGVPITSKKLSVLDCEVLVDKMVARIRAWGSRHLSYGGRAQLVDSVLLAVHYWSSVFILPVAVIKSIITVCRNYLWTGKAICIKSPPIDWDKLCYPKACGCLGFKECLNCNRALIGEYVWDIAHKRDNLWVKWVNHVYLKGTNWWNYRPPVSASWNWNQICKIKVFFTDRVHHGGRRLFNSGNYTVKDAYECLRPVPQNITWCRWVWCTTNIPKHSFITWLAMLRRLMTRVRLASFGVCSDKSCALCVDEDETVEHLFFRCTYSSRIWIEISTWLGIPRLQSTALHQCWRGSCYSTRSNSFRRKASAIALTSSIYHIWESRNDPVWNHKVPCVRNVVTRIKFDVKTRLTPLLEGRVKGSDRRWFMNL